MILTCPACDTKYVVKDDAIPPHGRQVRCASCKHSWHQEPELALSEPATAADVDLGGPLAEDRDPSPGEGDTRQEPPSDSAEVPQSEREALADEQSPWGAVAREPAGTEGLPPRDAGELAMEEAPAVADDWRGEPEDPVPEEPEEEEFVGYAPIADDEVRPPRRWPLILAILIAIVIAAAAFWFLAPLEWKQRAGLAQAGATPLQLMITTSDRQPLESGNELVAISGRVINPTDQAQQVPPIQAELRDKETRKLVHRWTIEPPARTLAPRSSASFNSAEVGVPEGGDELIVTLGAEKI